MATVKYNPTSPARRQMSVPDFAEITKFEPEKSLIVIKKKHAAATATVASPYVTRAAVIK